MLALLGYGMIVTFMVLLLTKKMSPFAALILVPVVFGLAAAFISGTPLLEVFDWIFGGLYYSLDENKTLISKGVAPTITLLLPPTAEDCPDSVKNGTNKSVAITADSA